MTDLTWRYHCSLVWEAATAQAGKLMQGACLSLPQLHSWNVSASVTPSLCGLYRGAPLINTPHPHPFPTPSFRPSPSSFARPWALK